MSLGEQWPHFRQHLPIQDEHSWNPVNEPSALLEAWLHYRGVPIPSATRNFLPLVLRELKQNGPGLQGFRDFDPDKVTIAFLRPWVESFNIQAPKKQATKKAWYVKAATKILGLAQGKIPLNEFESLVRARTTWHAALSSALHVDFCLATAPRKKLLQLPPKAEKKDPLAWIGAMALARYVQGVWTNPVVRRGREALLDAALSSVLGPDAEIPAVAVKDALRILSNPQASLPQHLIASLAKEYVLGVPSQTQNAFLKILKEQGVIMGARQVVENLEGLL